MTIDPLSSSFSNDALSSLSSTSDSLSGLPVVPETSLPADVRNGTDQDKQTYQAALGFERQLLTQLTQSMVDTTQNGDDDSDSSDDSDDSSDDGSDAVTQAYSQMLPDQLANAMLSGGGTGLADNLYQSLKAQEGQS
jgi:Rod binding domain-containing protein